MSLPPNPETTISISEQALASQAAALEQLRHRVAAAQAGGGKFDVALVAEFASAQRDYIDAKIAFERMRKAAAEAAEIAAAQAASEAAERAVAEAAAAAEAVAAAAAAAETARRNRRLLTGSRVFWLVVMLLLTGLLWFMHSKFAGQ